MLGEDCYYFSSFSHFFPVLMWAYQGARPFAGDYRQLLSTLFDYKKKLDNIYFHLRSLRKLDSIHYKDRRKYRKTDNRTIYWCIFRMSIRSHNGRSFCSMMFAVLALSLRKSLKARSEFLRSTLQWLQLH